MRRGYRNPIVPIVPIVPINSTSISEKEISCQKGLDLAYRKREHPRIVQEVQPRVLSFLRCAADDPLSQEIKEALFVVFSEWYILAIVEEDTTLSVARYTLKVDDI